MDHIATMVCAPEACVFETRCDRTAISLTKANNFQEMHSCLSVLSLIHINILACNFYVLMKIAPNISVVQNRVCRMDRIPQTESLQTGSLKINVYEDNNCGAFSLNFR